MKTQRLQVLAEGTCPFLDSVNAVCCYASMMVVR